MKAFIDKEEKNGLLRLDRREFIGASMALAAMAMLPKMAFSTPAKQRRRQ